MTFFRAEPPTKEDLVPGRLAEQLEKQLTCPVCLELFQDPVFDGRRCQHVFCRACILSSMQTNANCPKCRTRLAAHALRTHLMTQDLLDRLPVHCPNRCGWEGEAARRNGHLGTCPRVVQVLQANSVLVPESFEEGDHIRWTLPMEAPLDFLDYQHHAIFLRWVDTANTQAEVIHCRDGTVRKETIVDKDFRFHQRSLEPRDVREYAERQVDKQYHFSEAFARDCIEPGSGLSVSRPSLDHVTTFVGAVSGTTVFSLATSPGQVVDSLIVAQAAFDFSSTEKVRLPDAFWNSVSTLGRNLGGSCGHVSASALASHLLGGMAASVLALPAAVFGGMAGVYLVTKYEPEARAQVGKWLESRRQR